MSKFVFIEVQKHGIWRVFKEGRNAKNFETILRAENICTRKTAEDGLPRRVVDENGNILSVWKV